MVGSLGRLRGWRMALAIVHVISVSVCVCIYCHIYIYIYILYAYLHLFIRGVYGIVDMLLTPYCAVHGTL